MFMLNSAGPIHKPARIHKYTNTYVQHNYTKKQTQQTPKLSVRTGSAPN
jgi:hypothetical protein